MSHEAVLDLYDKRMYLPMHQEYYNQSDYYNLGYWHEDTPNQKVACENLVEKLLDFLPERRGTILDVACGKGATTKQLLKHYNASDVMGINISAKQLATSRVNAPDCSFLVMDAAQLAFRQDWFDNMICVEAAHHFSRERFLREAWRVLKPGGYLVLSDVLFTKLAHRGSSHMTVDNYVKDLEEYKALFLRAGFEEIKVVDATDESWGKFRAFSLRWARERRLWREISARNLLGFMLTFLLVGPLTIRHYYLVSARKM